MILLKGTTESLTITTTTVANIDYSVSYVDITASTFSPSTNEGTMTSGTATLVGSPAGSTQRQVKFVSITNRHATTANTVLVLKLIGATSYYITPTAVTLNAGESMQYVDGQGWVYYSITGAIKAQQTAAGSTGQIQFNNGGVLSGDSHFTWNTASNDMVLSGTDPSISINGITNEPASPSSGVLTLYTKSVAGRILFKAKGPSGLDYPIQPAFFSNNIVMWNPTTVTAGVWLATAGTGAGTYTTALPTTTSQYTAMKRARWANIATTANQVLGQRNTEAMFFIGSATGRGGFFFYTRCGFDVWNNGGRFFAGLATASTVVSAEPSALNNTVGFCVDSGDNGDISFLTRNATTATKQATGFTIVSGKGYDIYIFCSPNSTSSVGYRIVDIVAGTEYSGTASATLPVANIMLTANVLASNAALTLVTSIQLGLNRIYVETDY